MNAVSPEQITLLQELIQSGPVYESPSGQLVASNLLTESLEQLGWDEVFTQEYSSAELQAHPDYVPVDSFGSEYARDSERKKCNVFGVLHGATPGPLLILNGHYDVEPIANPARWDRPWNSGDLVDGRIYGRGAADMLSGLTSQMHVASALAANRRLWEGTIVFNAVPDEEIGGNGTLAALHEMQARGMLDDPKNTTCLIAEPSSSIIGTESYGFLHMQLQSLGTARHLAGLTPEDNALYPMLDAIRDFDNVLKDAAHELDPSIDTMMFNFGVLNGGIDAATPMDELTSEATIFYPASVASVGLEGAIRGRFKALGHRINVSFSEFRFDGQKSPANPLEDKLLETRPNKDIKSGIFRSPCDARLFGSFGVDQVVVYGPGSLAQAHAANEYVELMAIDEYNEHLYRALDAYFLGV